MLNTGKLYSFFALVVAFLPAHASNNVGLTAGQFRVDESGAASYSIPISVPQGRAGVTPQITLSYSSNNLSEGPLGVGWSLSGLSAISRCPQTPIHDDDNIQEVKYTSEDKFCLDGQRLFIIGDEVDYGNPDTSYHTEIDSFSTIIARGQATDNGPMYFEVKNKAGETHYYGNAQSANNNFLDQSDAFVEPGGYVEGSLARSWAIKVIKDVKDNYILFNYDKVTADGTFYIDNIQYTGNLATGDAPFAEVDFVYQDYKKGFKGYMAGAHVYHNRLLERIDSKIDGANYRSYLLGFENSNFIEERTLMTSVQECSDTGGSDCLPVTMFDWQRPALSTSSEEWMCEKEPGMEDFCHYQPTSTNYEPFTSSVTLATNTNNRETTQVFDINGDGYQDLVYVDDGYWHTKLGPYHSGSHQLSNIGADKHQFALNIDYDGDGIRDLLVANDDNSFWYAISYQKNEIPYKLCLYNSPCVEYIFTTDVAVRSLNVTAIGLEGAAQVMDVNGDGMEDIVYHQSGQLKAHINDGDGSFTEGQPLYSFTETVDSIEMNDGFISQSANMKSASAIDINGDGRSDLISKLTINNSYCVGTSFVNNKHECENDIGSTWITNIKTNYELFLSSGDVAAPQLTPVQTIGNAASISSIRVADINGDGLSDMLYVANDKWFYRVSNGTQLLSPREAHLITTDSLKGLTQFVDLNADGRADVLHATTPSLWHIYFSRPTSDNWISFQNRGTKNFDKNAVIRFGDVDGDGKLDMLTAKDTTWKKHYSRQGIKEYVINTITNGHGVATNISYSPMTDDTVYVSQAADADVNSDTFSPMSGMQLVSRVETDVNTGNKVAVEYQYGGLLVHKKGRGSLGFQLLRTIDKQSGVISETHYNQNHNDNNFAIARMPIYSEQRLNGKLLSSASNLLGIMTDTAQGGVFPYINASTEKRYVYGTDNSSTLVSQIESLNEYDNNTMGGWGNLTKSTVTVTDVATNKTIKTVTENNFGNASQQQYGRLQSTNVSKTRDGLTITRNSSFGYNNDNMLQTSIVSPNSLPTKLTTMYGYDTYGNKTSITVTGLSTITTGISTAKVDQTRTSRTEYDNRGLYVSRKTNSLGESVSYQYNGSTSSVTGIISSIKEIGPNGLAKTTYLDSFGQTTKTTGEDSTIVTIGQGYCSVVSCEISNAHYKVTKTITGAPDKEAYFDKWGREIAAQVRDFDDYWLKSTTTYDNQGRKQSVSEPGSNYYFTTFSYDDLGRVTKVTHPNDAITTQATNGLESSTTNDLGQVSKTFSNGFGETATTEDALGNLVTFTYDAFGNLLTSTTTADGKSSIVEAVYDNWGRKKKTIDPIKGTWHYTYNAFGELYTQKTARNHTFTFTYDELGRKIRSYEPTEGTLCWNYATTGTSFNKAIGKLISTAKYAGSNVTCNTNTTANIKKSFTYDGKGRAKNVTTIINSTSYVQSQTYDNYSRPLLTTYPTGEDIFNVKNVYNGNGYLTQVWDDTNNIKLKTIEGLTNRGQISSQTLGNGVTETKSYYGNNGWFKESEIKSGSTVLNDIVMTYDRIGNVKSRHSNYAASLASQANYIENYDYDDLNRLTSRTINISAGSFSLPATFKNTQSYNFDGWGNFTFKTGAGYYQYDATKVHKLLAVYDNASFTGNKLYDFIYDANGNITSDGNRNFTYGSFDKPTLITGSGASSAMKYGVSRELYYKEDCYHEEGVMVTTKTTYLGNYEKVERVGGANSSSLTEHKYYIGDIIYTQRSNSITDTLYLHKDHQGSVVATTNASGNIVSQAIYDPFGKRTSVYLDSYLSAYTEPTDRGYTGHKHISALDIIHMNGRIYDPTLGRFLQADPFVQAPTNSQSYNRYAYVFNNPLSYTDPSGYSAWTKFRDKVLKPVIAIAISVVTAGAGLAWAIAGGALSGYVMTGSLKGALIGAFSGALFYGAGDLIANNGISNIFAKGAIRGMAGGISSVLSGGKFGHGFAAAGFTSMAGGKIGQAFKDVGARVVANAIVGGTISRLTGGKFANGAITAAFMSAYNDANHPTGSKSAKFDGPLGDWFRSMNEGAAAIRSNIEGALTGLGNSISNALTTTADSTTNAARIAYNNPSKTLAAGGSIIGGAAACMTVKGCILGGPMIAYGVDQTHSLISGNSMTTSQQYLGDVLSHPDARAAFPFIENPHNAAGTIIDISTFATGGAGVSTLNLYNGAGNTMDAINAINDANTLKNY